MGIKHYSSELYWILNTNYQHEGIIYTDEINFRKRKAKRILNSSSDL